MSIQKTVIIDIDTYEALPLIIVRQLLDWSKQNYGVTPILNETGERITDEDMLLGALMTPLRRALKLE